MPIDTSKPSRELDIQLAKAVGYTARQITDKYWRIADPQGRLVETAGDWCEDESRPESIAWNDVPLFSSSRAAAFELMWTFDTFRIYRGEGDNGDDWINVAIDIWHDTESCWRQFNAHGPADQLPLLVCRAALQAKGVING